MKIQDVRRVPPGRSPAAGVLMVAFLSLLVSCLGPKRIDPAVNFNAATTQSIRAAEETREEAIKTLGELMERGIPVGDQLVAVVRSIDARVVTAIKVARTALDIYIQSGGSRSPVFTAMAVLNSVLAELTAEIGAASIPEAP